MEKLIINCINKKSYVILHEYWDGLTDLDPTLMKSAYNLEGDYIGDTKTANRLVKNYGIIGFEKRTKYSNVCSLGYAPKKRKWYGWSHRAVYGFTIGSKVKPGHCGYMPSNKKDFREDCLRFWTDKYHKTTTARFEKQNGQQGVYVSWEYNNKAPNKSLHSTISGIFTRFPDKWGKGSWTAKTMEDAKKMASDFAEGVS